MNTSRVIQVCLFLFIAVSPIQDFFLQGTPLRGLGASPSLFPLLVIIAVGSTQWLLSGEFKIKRIFLIGLVYIFLTALYGFMVFGFSSHGESLFWKSVTSFISLALVVLAVSQIDYSMKPAIRAGIYTALALLILGFCFSNANPFGLPPLLEVPTLHFTPAPDFRPRGLASESSELSVTAIVIGLLSVHITKSRPRKFLLFCLTIAILIASGSKGGIFTLFLCAIILCIIQWHSRWYQVAALVVLVLPLGAVLIALLPTLFPEDSFAFWGTVPTRVSMLFCALMTVVRHPFGVGLPGFLPAVAAYLPDAMDKTQALFSIPLNFTEVSAYLTSADMVSTKTFFFDQLMRFGLPFAVAFVIFVSKLIGRLVASKQLVMSVAVLAAGVAITTYISGTRGFAVPIVFGVALNEAKKCTESL